MKKTFLVFIILCIIILSSCKGEGFELYIQDGVEYSINQKKQIGYVGNQNWDCDLNNASLHIADEVENCKITSFGGYYGIGSKNSFRISFNYDTPGISFPSKENLSKECEKVEISFQIYLNKYLERVVFVGPFFEEYFIFNDSPNIAYYITYYFICPEENETFYSKDGKLYYKATNELVKEFYEIN